MITFGISLASGFVGGPIFPALFIGGTAGVLVHQVIPGVPLGLAFTCLLAAVPGSTIAAPFTMVLLAAFMTQVGALQTAPILIAVITAYLALEGVKYLMAGLQRQVGRRGERHCVPVEAPSTPGGHPSPGDQPVINRRRTGRMRTTSRRTTLEAFEDLGVRQ